MPSRLNAAMSSSQGRGADILNEFDGIKPIKLFSKSVPLKEKSPFISKNDFKEERLSVLKGERKRNGCVSQSPVMEARKKNSDSQLFVKQKELSKETEQKGMKSGGKKKLNLPLAFPSAEDTGVGKGPVDMSASLLSVATDLDFSMSLLSMKYPPVKIDRDRPSKDIPSQAPRVNEHTVTNIEGISDLKDMKAAISSSEMEMQAAAVTERSESPSLSELSQEEYPPSQSESETDTAPTIAASANPLKSKKGKFKVEEKSMNGPAVDSDVHVAEGIGLNCSPLRWRRGQAIGEGTFGRVYKGIMDYSCIFYNDTSLIFSFLYFP